MGPFDFLYEPKKKEVAYEQISLYIEEYFEEEIPVELIKEDFIYIIDSF